MITFRIIIVMLLWALCYPLITMGLPWAPHLSFAALRALLAGGTLLVLALWFKRPMPRGAWAWRRLVVAGFGATTLGFLGMFHAAEFVSPGVATVIANVQPLLAAILAHFVLRERLNPQACWGLLLGFLGIVVIAAPRVMGSGDYNYAIGVGYVLLAALGVTVGNVVIRQISGKLDALMAMAWQLLLGAGFLGIAAVATEDPTSITWSSGFIVSLVGLALFGTALAYWMWCRVLEDVPLTRANVFSFLVPVFGFAISGLLYGEGIEVATVAGTATTLVGIWLVSRSFGGV